MSHNQVENERAYSVNIPPYESVPVENQKIFPVTQDRARYVASEYIRRLRNTVPWSTPGGVLLTIVVVFISTDFKDALGLSRYTWQAIMLLVGVVALIWLLYSIFIAVRNKDLTADQFVEDLKGHVSAGPSINEGDE